MGYTIASLDDDIAVPLLHVDQLSEEEEEAQPSLDEQLVQQPSASILSPDDTSIQTITGNFICIEKLTRVLFCC